MIINKTRIQSVKSHLPSGLLDQTIYVSVSASSVSQELLERIGFNDASPGQQVVPAPQFKKVTFFNAEGGYIPLKELPKETIYREREWTWTDWSGTEHTKTVHVPYQRYQREPIPAPSETLSILTNESGENLIISEQVVYTEATEARIKHIINLFLEIFGSCEIRNARLDAIVAAPLVQLNWNLLPKGTTCWPALIETMTPVLARTVRGNNARAIIMTRLERLNQLNPDFVAVGRGGFYGYVIFGFESKERYVLESVYSGNAIYIFGNDWEALSKLTKAQIVNGGLHIARVVHKEGYWNQVVKQVA